MLGAAVPTPTHTHCACRCTHRCRYIFNALQATTPEGVPQLDASAASDAGIAQQQHAAHQRVDGGGDGYNHRALVRVPSVASSIVPRSVTSEMLRDADDALSVLPDVQPSGECRRFTVGSCDVLSCLSGCGYLRSLGSAVPRDDLRHTRTNSPTHCCSLV